MDIKQLMRSFPKSGRIEWIGIRTERGGLLKEVNEISATASNGLTDDHYKGKNKKRQVTLIQAEHIKAVADILGLESINPQELRRNIVISGANLLALKDLTFTLGTAKLKMTGYCHPCSRMEKNLGEGGYNAMRGHGGITAEILEDGIISIGDSLTVLQDQ
ncbi:MOSC domain-containing protein [Arcticibacterium luteifluviistationis]|uniref:MOSC domain-containing protein n=1 Tax=Arcticibacterium luteifluviistationis TaxID=1784714 RepID=A0A2Z4GBQ0_9BACT|nr:MOSC domain-containing protein [Arcticibacterium luteifluviistationis]AWV98564.1 MOSC domain-containing protein [Arcticibacterium luteifluviistationis]